jgi:hypothetical protein
MFLVSSCQEIKDASPTMSLGMIPTLPANSFHTSHSVFHAFQLNTPLSSVRTRRNR